MKIIAKIAPWMLFCLFALSNSTETIYSTALPSIASYFKITAARAQLTSTIYFIGFAIGILTLGRISDLYGRRNIILFGISLYMISSFLMLYAPSLEVLMCLRLSQAFGASVGSVVAQAMARDSYQGWELSYIYASLAFGIALIPSLGSSLSGYIVQYLGLHYIFGLFSFVSLILLMLYILKLPETNANIGSAKINKYSSIFKVIIKDKAAILYALIIGSFSGVNFGFYIAAPFFFIKQMNFTPSSYGKLALMLSAANLIGSLVARYLVKKHVQSDKIISVGLSLSIIGAGALVLFTSLIKTQVHESMYVVILIFLPMIIHIIGHNLLVPLCLRYALEDYAKVNGSAGSIFGFIYYMIVALINFTVSRLHESFVNFALLLLALNITCFIAFTLIKHYNLRKQKYEFD